MTCANARAAGIHKVTFEERTVNPHGEYIAGRRGTLVMPIKFSTEEIFLAKASVIDIDAMKTATAAHDRRGCASGCLALARALDHLSSDQQLLFRDPLDLRRVMSQDTVVHSWEHVIAHDSHPSFDARGA